MLAPQLPSQLKAQRTAQRELALNHGSDILRTMDLQSFVTQTLEQIVRGVKAAQDNLNGSAVVNPPVLPGNRPRPADDERNPVQTVEFDVALTTSESVSDKAGAGLFIACVTLGATNTTGHLNSAVSRLRFSVNLQLPLPTAKTVRTPTLPHQEPNENPAVNAGLLSASPSETHTQGATGER